MTTMPQCCKLCGAYQGKVYSISGTDKRFPALFKTVLRSGYALPHPNCRHEFIPWYEEIEAPEDVEKAIKNSKIQYDKNGELVDVRYQRDIKGYAEWQAGNRQLNRELLEYEQMKAYYAGREADMLVKSLGAFRRARRANTETYKELRKNLQNDLTSMHKSDILVDVIHLPDEALPHSLGAKWSNYDIRMPDGTVAHFQEGSKLHHKEVFAGKSCRRKIDDIERVSRLFPDSRPQDIEKVKAIGTIVTETGEVFEAEIHWYQADGLRDEHKVKRLL
jgi:hypothetical protein